MSTRERRPWLRDRELVRHREVVRCSSVPPYAKTCAAPVKWLDNHCLATAKGVEWDWLSFLESTNSAPLGASTFPNLTAIYRGACGGGSCDGLTRYYSNLQLSAQNLYGITDVRYTTFVNNGNAYGVNH